jgi:hypothetical protein
MESLDQFKTNNFKHHCSLCGKELTRYSRVSILATDPNRQDKYTRKPMMNSYKFILCPNHFDDFKAAMAKFITDNAKKTQTATRASEVTARVHADIDDIEKLLDN